MRRFGHWLLALSLMTPLVSVAGAEGLGDVAAKEKQKRQKKPSGSSAPSYGNEDLAPPKKEGASASAPATAAAPAASSASEAPAQRRSSERPDGEQSAQAPSELQNKVEAAQAQVTALETRVADLQAKLNPMSGSFIYGAGGSNSADEELRVRSELTQAERDLAQAREALTAAQQALQNGRRTPIER